MRVAPAAWLLCAGMLIAAQAGAADNDFYAPGSSASIELGRYRTDFLYSGASRGADVGRYGITFAEPVSPWVSLGLQGGLLTISFNNGPLAPASDNGGRYLGLFSAWHAPLGNYFGLEGRVSYTWHDDNFQLPNQQAQVSWFASRVSLGPVLRVGRWRLSAGGYWQRYDGSETDSGALNQKLDFSAARNGGAYAGFAYYLDRTGSVGLYATQGGQRSVRLVFRREF